jgi:phenylalanyl-tRNA synthetase alpha subunit
MRSKLHIIVIGLFITIAGAYSQISLNKVLKNVKKNAEKQIEQRIERKADKAVDKTLDKAEESIDNTVKNVGKKKDEDKETKDKNIPAENEQEKQETPTVEKASPVSKLFLKMIFRQNKMANFHRAGI